MLYTNTVAYNPDQQSDLASLTNQSPSKLVERQVTPNHSKNNPHSVSLAGRN